MRKVLSLLLVIAMLLPMCACGASGEGAEQSAQEISTVEVEETPEEIVETTPEPEPTPEPTWSIIHSIDEFGDVTEDSIPLVAGVFEGSFSNTATSDSDLTVVVNFMKKGDYNHYIAMIDLKEYNDTNATYHSGDTITFKMKVGDEIIEDTMTGNPPNESVCLGVPEYSWGGDFLYNALYEGEDVRCIITIGSSEYNFTVTSDNFAAVCEQNGYGLGAADLTVKEAVKMFLDDTGAGVTYTRDWFYANADKTELMDSSEIKELLEGYFLEISIGSYTADPNIDEYWFPWWYVYYYSPSTNSGQCMANYDFDTDFRAAANEARANGETVVGYAGWRVYDDPQGYPLEVSAENDMLTTVVTTNGYTAEYQCRSITDDLFLLCAKESDGTFKPQKLLFRSNGYAGEDIITAVQYALEVSLPLIEN